MPGNLRQIFSLNREILRLAIPNIITNITVPLLGLVDLALMGHLDGPEFIGAIALGSLIFNVIYSSFNFLRMSSSGFASQAFGAKLPKEISLVLVRSLIVAFGLAFFLIVLQYPIQWISFQILDGSETVKGLAREYFYVRIWAAPATLGLYAFFGWFLGVQNAKIPMIIALVINLINIALNFLFVYGFGMTSAGVALSTVIAQYSGFLLAIYYLIKKYPDFIQKFPLAVVLQKQAIIKFFKVNSDIFIRTVLLLLTLAFFTNMSARHGDEILAVNTLLFQFFFMFSYFEDGFAYAGEALVGKAMGAGSKLLLKKTVRSLFYWGWATAIVASAVFALGFNTMMHLLTDNELLRQMAQKYDWWVVIIPLTSSAAFIWDGVFVGVTASRGMRNAMMVSSLLVFLPIYYLTVNSLHNHALWLALNAFMVARGLMMWWMWQKMKQTNFVSENATSN